MVQHESPQAVLPSWQVSVAGRLYGPLDETGLMELARSGVLTCFSLVQSERRGEWRIISTVPELAALLPDLPARASFTMQRLRPSHSQFVAILAVAFLVGSYWASRLGQSGRRTARPVYAFISRAPALATQAQAALSAGRWQEGLEAGRQYLEVADAPEAALREQQQAWAELILKQLTPGRSGSSAETRSLLKTCLEWAPGHSDQVAERSLVFALDALSTGSLRLAEVEAYFDLALGIGLDGTPTSVTQIAWSALAARLTNLPALGREGFERLFARCVIDDLPETVTAHPAWLLAQALHFQAQGDWEQALPLLRNVAASPVDPVLAQIAQKILAPPEPGRREYQRRPIFSHTPAKRPAIRIELLAAEVTTEGVLLELRLTNTAVRRQRLAYPAAPGNTRRSYDPLCLIDEHGRAITAPLGFGEVGRPVPGEGNLRVIELARGERALLQAHFPLLDPGATRARFVSPRIQNQSEWGWADIPLKAGPFDPPLAILPLQPAQPSPKEIAQVAVTTPTSTTMATATATTVTTERAVQASTTDQVTSPPPSNIAPTPSTAPPTPTPAEAAAEQKRATTARQQAQKAQEQSRNRLASGNRALKRSLFDSAEQQCRTAEDAYQAGDYAKAEVYFKQAIDIFRQVPR